MSLFFLGIVVVIVVVIIIVWVSNDPKNKDK